MTQVRNHRKHLIRATLVVVVLVVAVQVAARLTRWTHNRKVAYLGGLLYVEEHGGGSPVLLLHGLRGSGSYWSDLVQTMAARPYRLIVPDLLGFGRSPWPLADYSVADHIEALRRSVEADSGKEQMIIVGHSMGAILAVEYARRYPDEVSGLVLINAPVFESEAQAREKIREMSPMAAAFSLNDVLARASCDVVCAARPVLWYLAPVIERDVPADVARHGVLHRWESFDGSLRRVVLPSRLDRTLQSIGGIPVAFIHGETDPVTDGTTVRNLASTLRAPVSFVQGGHNILLEEPAETARLVQEAIAALNATNG